MKEARKNENGKTCSNFGTRVLYKNGSLLEKVDVLL
jgi:hypothetical protein